MIDWLNVQSIDNDDHKLDKYALKTNDLIITSKSSKVKMAVVDIKLEEKFIATGGMIVVRPKIEKLNPTYLKIYLESEQGQNIIKSVQKGVTIVTLNAKDLSKVLYSVGISIGFATMFTIAGFTSEEGAIFWYIINVITKIAPLVISWILALDYNNTFFEEQIYPNLKYRYNIGLSYLAYEKKRSEIDAQGTVE